MVNLLNLLDGPPSKVPTIKRSDIDRIYSEYVKTTLKTADGGASKPHNIAKPSKADSTGNPEKAKRKYRKRVKEQQVSQNNTVSLLKPLNFAQAGGLK